MGDHDLHDDALDELLDGTADREALPSEYARVAEALDDLRILRTEAGDPSLEAATLRAMSEAARPRPRRRLRLAPAGVRVAIAIGAVALVGTAGATLSGTARPAGDVAHAVLQSLGIEPEDEADREADEADREADEAEREAEEEAEGNKGLPAPAVAGRALADERRASALAYTDAVRRWTECVREAAAAHGPSGAREDFDPVAACGEHPRPQDFGLGADDGEEPEERKGPPASAGPPADAGPPPDAGPPADAGPPPGSGAPATAGPPPGAGPPANAGPPPSAGPPPGAGPPGAG
jgi:hypothetical protein